MILEQVYVACLSHASYLVADETTGVGVVVDPRRDVGDYLKRARSLGVQIEHVLLTHFHSDFVSGHLELRACTGATIHLGAAACADYPFVPHADGEALNLGALRFVFLATPGHTPESTCIVLYDRSRDERLPQAVFTGDTLLVGDVGRPDLFIPRGQAPEALAAALYDSLQQKLLILPDTTRIYPAHGPGWLVAKNVGMQAIGKKTGMKSGGIGTGGAVSTLGEQKRLNPALQPMSRDAFVKLVCTDQPEPPVYFAHDAALNRRMRATLDESLQAALHPLSLDAALRLQQQGAHLLDVRSEKDYTSAHLIGSVHVGLEGPFASWCGTVLDPEHPIVLLAEPGQEEEAATRLGRIGFDRVAGYLDGGIEALEERPDLLRHTPRISARALGERLAGNDPPHILDVRSRGEWEAEHIVGSIHIPLEQLRTQLDQVPRNSNFVVHCAVGYRSAIASSILEQHGFTNFSDLAGGYLAWELTEN